MLELLKERVKERVETAFIFTYVAWRTFLTNASKMPSLLLDQQFVESWNCKFFCPPPPSLYWAVENRISNPKRNVYLLRIKPIYEYQHDLSSLMKAVIVKSVNELFFLSKCVLFNCQDASEVSKLSKLCGRDEEVWVGWMCRYVQTCYPTRRGGVRKKEVCKKRWVHESLAPPLCKPVYLSNFFLA